MNRMQDEQVPERMKEIGPAPPYLTPAEVAQRWRKHPSTIRRMFRDHPGTLKFGKTGHRYSKREYVELLIQEAISDFLASKRPEIELVTYRKYVKRLDLLSNYCKNQHTLDVPSITPALLNSYKLQRCEALSALT
jgi:hypothetical protein